MHRVPYNRIMFGGGATFSAQRRGKSPVTNSSHMTPYFFSKASFRAGQGFKFNRPYAYLGKSEGF
jgi:hypothetical protein